MLTNAIYTCQERNYHGQRSIRLLPQTTKNKLAGYGGERPEQGAAVELGRQDGARHRREQGDRVS